MGDVTQLTCDSGVPVGLTVGFAVTPKNLDAAIRNRACACCRIQRYAFFLYKSLEDGLTCSLTHLDVVYPREGQRPPTADELRRQTH